MTAMTLALQISCLAVLISLLLILMRALMGPTRYDRILAVNLSGVTEDTAWR